MTKSVLAELVTQMTIESAQFKKELEKSTAKQAAFGASARQAANDSHAFDGSLKRVAKQSSDLNARLGAATIAVGAFSAAMLASTRQSINNAAEIQKLSRITNQSVEDFQAYAFAFGQFGVEQDKYADIIKDVQDKLGDFIATGAGPFKDFFEQVAPLVGITADQLNRLSGPDVLIAVKNALDEANVSAKEQVFYFESIANDATILIPALKDSGKAISDLTNEYRGLNTALSQTEIDQLKDSKKEFAELSAAASRLNSTVTLHLAPALTDLANLIQRNINPGLVLFNGSTRNVSVALLELQEVTLKFLKYNPASSFAGFLAGFDFDQAIKNTQGASEQLRSQVRQLRAEYEGVAQGKFGPTDNIFEVVDDPFNLEGAVTNIQEQQQTLNNAAAEYAQGFWSAFQDSLAFEQEASGLQDLINAPLTVPDEFDFSSLDEMHLLEQQKKLQHYNELERLQQESNQRRLLSQRATEVGLFNLTASYASQAFDLIGSLAGEGSALQKAAFIASKAVAVATTIVNTEMAAISALAPPPVGLGPVAGLGYSKLIRGLGYTSAALIGATAVSGARKGGGRGTTGEPLLVGERGPEIFTPSATGQITSNENLRKAFGEEPTLSNGANVNITLNVPPQADPNMWYVQNRNRIIRDISSSLGSRL